MTGGHFLGTAVAVALGVWIGMTLHDSLRLGDKIRAALS
jgi:hypothetical protein